MTRIKTWHRVQLPSILTSIKQSFAQKDNFMKKERLADTPSEFSALIAELGRERGELKLKIHLARCGIWKEWEKAERKWQSLQAENKYPLSTAQRLARELKHIYYRIYQGLLGKNTKLLEQLRGIDQAARLGNIAGLEALKRQVNQEVMTIHSKLEILAGAGTEIIQPAEEEPVCACLKCRQDTGKQPFDLDQLLKP